MEKKTKYDDKCFTASDDQLKECFRILDENGKLRSYFELPFDQADFEKNLRFSHSHSLAKNLTSKAAESMRNSLEGSHDTVILAGVSGCGKSHAIFINALEKTCIYLTAYSNSLRKFSSEVYKIRLKYGFQSELQYRQIIQQIFYKYVCARFLVLLYIKQEFSISDERLFFTQSRDALATGDLLMRQCIETNYTCVDENLLSNCFVAIDEAQSYSFKHNLFQIDAEYEQSIPFFHFFPWCSPILGAPVVMAGTSSMLADTSRLGSVNWESKEYAINIIQEFDYFNSTRVKEIVLELVGTDADIDASLMNRMGYFLQGRPRILMNFIQRILTTESNIKKYFKQYVSQMIEFKNNEFWGFYRFWVDLFTGWASETRKVKLSLRDPDHYTECAIPDCFLRILMDSIRLLDDKDVDDEKTIIDRGSWFKLESSAVDFISVGLCPVVSLKDSEYCFWEPLSLLSGLRCVVAFPDLYSQFNVYLLEAMFSEDTCEHDRGFYLNMFVAMKLAADAEFRTGLFNMALKLGKSDDRTKWISYMKLPERDFCSLRIKPTDDEFVRCVEPQYDNVNLSREFSRPDIKWWIFMFSIKSVWKKSNVDKEESRRNAERITPDLCFDCRGENEEQTTLRNQKCEEESYEFVRVRIELPNSPFESAKQKEITNDIHLDLNWNKFRTLLSKDEADRFQMYF